MGCASLRLISVLPMTEPLLHIHIFAVAAMGPSVSGGDKIFIESARVWIRRGHRVTIYVTEEGLAMCQRHDLKGPSFVLVPTGNALQMSFAWHYLLKIFRGMLAA